MARLQNLDRDREVHFKYCSQDAIPLQTVRNTEMSSVFIHFFVVVAAAAEAKCKCFVFSFFHIMFMYMCLYKNYVGVCVCVCVYDCV